MAFANPAINPPHLPSPTKRGFHTTSPPQSPNRSPNRSPVRHYARDFDPLLRDLSPTTTLRAFAVQSPDREPDFLTKSVATASNSERALGAKAAQACADLRSWARELEQWQWTGTFEAPEWVRKKQRMSEASLLSMRPKSPEDDAQESEYWGSLPAQMVRAYETRVDEINEDLDGIDVEELKQFVLAAHSQAGIGEASIDDSIGAIGAATDLGRLDDFTALITATILQALPYLSRLARLINTWTIRLAVLHAAPDYLKDLKQARTDLDHGWAALAVSPNPANAKFGRETMEDMKGIISSQVRSLGRRLDHFLDELEGREEVVPDSWIDDFEHLEGNYGEWVVRAERKVHENEWHAARIQQEPAQAVKSGESLLRAEGGLIGRTLSKMTVESRELPGDGDAVMRPESAMQKDQSDSKDFAESGESQIEDEARPVPTVSRSSSPRKYSRHEPITIDFDEAGQKLTSTENLTALPLDPKLAAPRDISPAVEAGSTSETVPNVKKRAAFLNRDIETSNQLNRSKPPPIVRPFEHASNAFTKLFKQDSQIPPSSSSDTTESEKRTKGVRRRSFGRRTGKDRVVSNKENVRPDSEKLGYADLTALPKGRKSEDVPQRGRRLSREETRSLYESTNPGKNGYADLTAVPVRWSEESGRSRPRTPKKIVPATYQPTTLGSPFHETSSAGQGNEFPENWPLSESATPQDALSPTDDIQEDEINRAFGPPVMKPPRPSQERKRRFTAQADENDYDELRLHKSAPETDALEEFFVDSMPTSPAHSRPGSRKGSKSLHKNRHSKDSATTKSSLFSAEELARRSLEIERYQKQQADASLPLSISTVAEEEVSPALVTPPRSPAESAVNYDATENAIFGSSPRSKDRGSRISRASMLMASPELAKLQMPGSHEKLAEATLLQDVANGKSAPETMRRASIQSIKSYPHAELKGVDITPRSPTSPNSELPMSIERIPESQLETEETVPRSLIAGPSSPTSPLSDRDSFSCPSPLNVPERVSSLNASPETGRRASRHRRSFDAPSSPVITDDYDLAATPLSKSKSKRKYKDVPSTSPATAISPSSTKSKAARASLGGDNFDRHVGEVLDRVHAPIRFRSRPGAETPQPPSSKPEAGGKARSYSRLQQPKLDRQSTKSMTLAPAESSPKKTSAASDPEVKLYHLTQAGRTEPIKLFVRLVGEGERVMVRVGGGWADLADYLRQYAEHHGSRTVSEGTLEVQTAAAANPTTGARRTFSTPVVPASESKNADASAARGTPAPAPLDRAATTTADISADRPSWLNDPQPRFTMGDSDESDVTNTPATPTLPLHSSRPGTSSGKFPSSRPQSRQAEGSSFGMAGPSAGAAPDLPEQKARWVEGMLAKARESAEKSEKFAEMGRVGGTRRVVFREGK